MKTIVTGLNGTVAPAVAYHLMQHGHAVVGWQRAIVATDNDAAMRQFIRTEQPDWFVHIATGSAAWAEAVARICAEAGIKFLYTSSASVYAHTQVGPFSITDVPAPNDDYGRYKLESEQRVQAAHPEALIARLAWQIGVVPGSNNMIDYLQRNAEAHGHIEASTCWYPASAFLMDTAESIVTLLTEYPAGLYQLDGNPGLNFYEIATELNRLHGHRWKIVPSQTHLQNNRMLDAQIKMRSITQRFYPR